MPGYRGGPLAMRQKYLIIVEFIMGILFLLFGIYFFLNGPIESSESMVVIILVFPMFFNVVEGFLIGFLPAVLAGVYAAMDHVIGALICLVFGCINIFVAYVRWSRVNSVKKAAALLNVIPPEQLLKIMSTQEY